VAVAAAGIFLIRATSFKKPETPKPAQRKDSVALSSSATPTDRKQLHPDRIRKEIKKIQYAVRGELVLTALALEEKLKKQQASGSDSTEEKLPFDEIVFSNLGNPQELGQKPITFYSQVLGLLNVSPLLALDESKESKDSSLREALHTLFPSDVIERAKTLRANISGGLGAYTHSKGVPYVRKQVAKFIEQRDGFPSDPENIFLTNGASPGISYIIHLLTRDEHDGIMIPNPQYPLYTATIQEAGGAAVPYRLDESKDWSLNLDLLEKTLADAKKKGIRTRAIVVINPGNPTGQCLTIEDIRNVIEFAARHRLVILADEVYQGNVFDPERPFHSFKKVLCEIEKKGTLSHYDPVELTSFHSVSKGNLGECGRRGGYLECYNIHPDVVATIYKLASVSLCSNSTGQVMVELMVNPPKEGDPSYALWLKESTAVHESLKRRADKLVAAFRSMEGMSCTKVTGALYAFPQITIPKKALEAAKSANKVPDVFYCLELLKATGICLVPGSGFKPEAEDVYHFRTTILPVEEKIDGVIEKIGKFHASFMNKYRD
jgi:alanine transaminase